MKRPLSYVKFKTQHPHIPRVFSPGAPSAMQQACGHPRGGKPGLEAIDSIIILEEEVLRASAVDTERGLFRVQAGQLAEYFLDWIFKLNLPSATCTVHVFALDPLTLRGWKELVTKRKFVGLPGLGWGGHAHWLLSEYMQVRH